MTSFVSVYGFALCSGLFLCFVGLPPAVLLLYRAGLPSVVLGPNILS